MIAAAVLVAAYVALIVRPARIPKDAVLTLRIADGIRDEKDAAKQKRA